MEAAEQATDGPVLVNTQYQVEASRVESIVSTFNEFQEAVNEAVRLAGLGWTSVQVRDADGVIHALSRIELSPK